jgi:hypothetical protein
MRNTMPHSRKKAEEVFSFAKSGSEDGNKNKILRESSAAYCLKRSGQTERL